MKWGQTWWWKFFFVSLVPTLFTVCRRPRIHRIWNCLQSLKKSMTAFFPIHPNVWYLNPQIYLIAPHFCASTINGCIFVIRNFRRIPLILKVIHLVRFAGQANKAGAKVPSICALSTVGSNLQLSALQTMINVIIFVRNLLYSVQKVDSPTLKSTFSPLHTLIF